MAGTSIASQLQALRAALHVSDEPQPGRKRPFTRPSILFDPKEAADIDIEAVYSISVSGLDDLVTMEERFRSYKNDLFSHQTKELDRELLAQEENKRIDASISSYLRLLSGFLESNSALKTMEYLIRRYKVNVFNKEDLILCALPYHDTHIFVRIVRLIDTRNGRWGFLHEVKAGARMPREVLVQQCIRDLGVLWAICDYATTVKKIHPSKRVTCFCTAVVFEVLGFVTITSNILMKILPYLSSWLKSGRRGLNQKAGAMMILSLLVQKAALSSNVAKSFLHLVADIARENTIEGNDLRMPLMTFITIVQLQRVDLIPKKTVDMLNGIRDLPRILAALNNEFVIDKFLAILVDSLVEHCASDDVYNCILLSLIEIVPMKDCVQKIVFGLLTIRMKVSHGELNSISAESGNHVKQILTCLNQKYPNEFHSAFFSFFSQKDAKTKNITSSYDALCTIVDEHFVSSDESLDPKLLFALEHLEPEVRRLAISNIDTANILREKADGSKKFNSIQDALCRRLYDKDLNVVLAVLTLDNLADVISSPLLFEAVRHVLQKCIEIMISSSRNNTHLRNNVAFACVQQVMRNFKDKESYSMMLAGAFFPLLLVRPKTQVLNFKALELAKELSWPFYENLVYPKAGQELEVCLSSINSENIIMLGEAFSSGWEECMPWLAEFCKSDDLSKTLFFLVLLQSLKILKKDAGQFLKFFGSCFPIIKNEWEMLESVGVSAKQATKRITDGDCLGILEDLLDTEINDLNSEILACLLLRLLKVFPEVMPGDGSLDVKGVWMSNLHDMFLFFVNHSKDVFQRHLDFMFSKCKISMSHMMLNMLTEEGLHGASQIEVLHSLSRISSQLDESSASRILFHFPSFLIPLSCDIQNVREAAMSCIEALLAFFPLTSRNGNSGAHLQFLGETLGLLVQQKKMIISDTNVLVSLLTSLLSSSSGALLVQKDIEKRFDESTKNEMLIFIVNHAVGLPGFSKMRILSLIKGVGSKLFSVPVLRSMLTELLECMEHGNAIPQSELEILCFLLEICCQPSSSRELYEFEGFILKTLRMTGLVKCTVVGPCIAVLRSLNNSLYAAMTIETKEIVFCNLLVLLRSKNGDVQNSAKDALMRLQLDCSVVRRVLDSILGQKTSVKLGKKQRKSDKHPVPDRCYDVPKDRGNMLFLLSSLLDFLLMKENSESRTILLGPLFKLFSLIFTSDDWKPKPTEDGDEHMSDSNSQSTIISIQQSLLLVLENISASLGNNALPEDIIQNFDLQLVISCARSSTDAVSRNHIFSFLTNLVKIMPDVVLDHILDILSAVAESSVKQWDSYSQRVFEDLISAIIPSWLSLSNNSGDILQMFVNILPQVAEHRRFSIIAHILRTLGETESLGSLLFLLFHSIISRLNLPSDLSSNLSMDHVSLITKRQWEYEFALQLFGSYSCTIWLPSLVVLLKKFGDHVRNEKNYMGLLVVMLFISDKLQDPEISYMLESEEDLHGIQHTVGELMEQIVYHQQLVDSAKKTVGVPDITKSEVKIFIRSVLRTLMKGLPISLCLKVIIKLLDTNKEDIRKKALQLFCETMKDLGTNKKSEIKGKVSRLRNSWLHLDANSLELVEKLCLETLKLFDSPDDVSSTSMKMTALSALEVLADRFPLQDSVFSLCLGSVCKRICSEDSAISIHCLLATGALVNALGVKALPELATVMQSLLKKSQDIHSEPGDSKRTTITDLTSNSTCYVFTSILQTLVTVTDKLAGFLNPYLGNILSLVILHPQLYFNSEPKLKLKADALRDLIIEKIPVRLLLPPLLAMFPDTVKCGENSVSTLFIMLGKLVSSMVRASIAVYHAKVFDLCLLALDLRHKRPASIGNIDLVEQNIIDAFVALTMKLTEMMFRPLFIKIVEWATSTMDDVENSPGEAYGRVISFYRLVNKLAESHRSLFVPFFKYLLDDCIKGLVVSDDAKLVTSQKKRRKTKNNLDVNSYALSPQVWRLRALNLTALHNCFLYDTGIPKFLDSSNFQVLLKPIVSQLVVEPPEGIENQPNMPSTKEVDDLLVACIGQMAVTADSDLLWKPLNHEVLMQTRSEKLRPRILGLRVVKYLVDNLRDGYMAFLPETIPFLSELLEDSEHSVKSLAQEILLEMETISGESLKEYL